MFLAKLEKQIGDELLVGIVANLIKQKLATKTFVAKVAKKVRKKTAPKKTTHDQIKQLAAEGLNANQISKKIGVTWSTAKKHMQ